MNDLSISEELGRQLTVRGLTLAVAESCTGGLLASRITDIPGSSAYFLGGVITYQNEVKQRLLGVPSSVLASVGAVSPQTAAAMARGCRALFESDVTAATTGIAGPGGGSAEKPVGLVYIAVAMHKQVVMRRFQWSGDRLANKESTVAAALSLLLEMVTTNES